MLATVLTHDSNKLDKNRHEILIESFNDTDLALIQLHEHR